MSGFAKKVSNLQDRCLDNCSGFGEKVVFRPQVGGSFIVDGIFFDDFSAQETETGTELFTVTPNVDVKLEDLPFRPKMGDRFEVQNQSYKIVSVEPDSLGMVTCFLHRERRDNR